MSNPIRTRWFLACAGFLAVLFAGLAALPVRSEPTTEPAPTEEKNPMTPTATARRAGIPPIDAAAPAKTETATFALG